jgi:dihydroxy-acid dehydratase
MSDDPSPRTKHPGLPPAAVPDGPFGAEFDAERPDTDREPERPPTTQVSRSAKPETAIDRAARPLRSQAWFGKTDKDGFIYRSWMRNQGLPSHLFDGRPVIGICNTWSELTPCNAHLRRVAEYVKRGVYEAGGFPLEFPVMSLGETLMRPTTMMFRNLAAMDVEESLRANPIDGVVLLVGCDKTTPALMMGAASCDLPTLTFSGGPMLNGKYRGQDIGSGTGVWKFSDEVKKGRMSLQAFMDAEACMSRSVGHCMTMGTASTMASMVESLGMGLPTNAAIPAADSRRMVLAHMAGRRIVEMVHEDLRMSRVLTRAAFENAILVNGAIGGSTNAIVHHLALAGRVGIDITLDDWDRLGREVPCLVDLMPSGKYLMEDFFYAGGVPAVVRALEPFIHKHALTINGRTLWENCQDAENFNPEVIRSLGAPFSALGGIVVLRGNLAPNGAVLKPSAASRELMQHTGRAVVFEDIDDYKARIDDPELDIEPADVMVLKNCGPKGYAGFPEVGNMALPKKLLERGVTDMVRVSDARMSGTAYGTAILHVAPEAAVGGVLGLVESGDRISVDVEGRQLHLDVSEAELARRRQRWKPPAPEYDRGYYKLFREHVLQADQGVDFDFLRGASGAKVPKDSH